MGRFIILRKIKFGEADLVLHAIGANGGKFSFLAKGALRSKKRYGGGVLEPSHFVQFVYKEAKTPGQLNVLHEATLINGFEKIKKTYDHLELALHVVDCVAKVSQEGDENSDFLFNLTGHTLKAVENSTKLAQLKLHFYLKLLYQQGVISTEPWMMPFLKTNLSESESLNLDGFDIEDYLPSIETLVHQYVRTADAGF